MPKRKAVRIRNSEYTVPAGGKELSSPLRLAFLSDLHCEDFGNAQSVLMDAVRAFDPHVILIGGDAYDERRSWDKANETISLCAGYRPTYYTPGNHEIKTGDPEECSRQAVQAGAVLLAGTGAVFSADGNEILLCGAEDPLRQEEEHKRQMDACAEECLAHPRLFSVLMSHHPEFIAEYRSHPADLILTGHAHGGQWIFPFAKNGFLAPQQGFFPNYTGGEFVWESNRMIVSRGLGNVTPFPRFGNPPELVCVTIAP